MTKHDMTEDILKQCLLGQGEEAFEKVRKYARLNKETKDKNGGTLVAKLDSMLNWGDSWAFTYRRVLFERFNLRYEDCGL